MTMPQSYPAVTSADTKTGTFNIPVNALPRCTRYAKHPVTNRQKRDHMPRVWVVINICLRLHSTAERDCAGSCLLGLHDRFRWVGKDSSKAG
jgi:hypothetical protein